MVAAVGHCRVSVASHSGGLESRGTTGGPQVRLRTARQG